MPSGQRHTIASITVAASSGAALFIYSPPAAFWCSFGALVGVMLSCDLDVDKGNISYHYMRKYAGMPAELLWRIVWKPYSLLARHRGFLSHAPIVSTAGRLLYLWLWILPIWLYLKLPMPQFSWEAGWWLLGLCLVDSVHFLLDFADSKLGGRL